MVRVGISTKLGEIPPGVYEKRSPNKKLAYHNTLSRADATRDILDETSKVLGISLWRIANLLNLPNKHLIYRWGASESSISAFYLARLTKLIFIRISGVDFTNIDYINWETGEVFLKENEQNSDNISGSEQRLSKRLGHNKQGFSDISGQQQKPDETRPKRKPDLARLPDAETQVLPRTRKYRHANAPTNPGSAENDLRRE